MDIPGVKREATSVYSSIILLTYRWTIADLGDQPPSLRSWSIWLSVKFPPFSMAEKRTNRVANPCKLTRDVHEVNGLWTNFCNVQVISKCVVYKKKLSGY